MILFPAIDMLGGRAVRLLRGEFDKVTDYGQPAEMAAKWRSQGAEFLHVVDLDGAKNGAQGNRDALKSIIGAVDIPVQLGGGIRTLADIEDRLNFGVARVILGTVCCKDPELVLQAVRTFGSERIVCGIDAKDGSVAVSGWAASTQIDPIELGRRMKDYGVDYVVYTDISRDGALTGVNTAACKAMAEQTGLRVIASGGVSCLSDITALDEADMYGAILGKAIYENKFSVADAIACLHKLEREL